MRSTGKYLIKNVVTKSKWRVGLIKCRYQKEMGIKFDIDRQKKRYHNRLPVILLDTRLYLYHRCRYISLLTDLCGDELI